VKVLGGKKKKEQDRRQIVATCTRLKILGFRCSQGEPGLTSVRPSLGKMLSFHRRRFFRGD